MAKALPLTLGYIFLNTLVWILIASFAMDDVSAGHSTYYPSDTSEISMNESVSSVSLDDLGFIERMVITLHDMPWWVQVFIVLMNTVVPLLLILAWVRGI